jgi:hypothetical protein
VPVCQSGSIEQVVTDRSTDGHCDCAFWINYYRWCWSDLGSLMAPRAFLIASGSEDILWRPIGYRDVANRIRLQYKALGAGENFDIVEDATPHGYTPKLRRAIFTWFNTHLKDDPTPVTDDVTEFVEPEENLLVFGGKLPEHDEMRRIDKLLVRRDKLPEITDKTAWRAHQIGALKRLRKTTFRNTRPDRAPRLREFRNNGRSRGSIYSTYAFDSFDGLTLAIKTERPETEQWPIPTLVFAVEPGARSTFAGGRSSRPRVGGEVTTAAVAIRNTGATSVGPGYLWTARRTYPLLGETLSERQVSDLLAAFHVLRSESVTGSLAVYGEGETATQAIYAALLDPKITEIVLADPPTSHEDPNTAQYLGVLRVGDLPHNLALAYPRRITFVGKMPEAYAWTKQLYEKLGAGKRIRTIRSMREWRPQPDK